LSARNENLDAMEPTPAPPVSPDPSRLPRHLGTGNAALLLVTFTIGVGILQSPSVVAAKTGSMALSYLAWVVGAVAAVSGALVMAELAVRTPRSGGTTVFLREAYGPRVAFLFGWTSMLLNPVAAAAITLVSVRNLGTILGWSEQWQTVIGVSWAGAIMLLNMISSRTVGRIIGGVGLGKISALAAVVAVCFAGGGATATAAAGSPPEVVSPWVGFGLAVVATMFAYDGWDGLALVAGEVRQPARTLPRATFLGMGLILAVYLAVNAGFFHALPFGEMATTPALAATAVGRVIGDQAARFVTVFVAFSAASTVFSSLMCNPRVVFALAEEGAFFRRAAYVHPRWRTPVVAIAIYGVMVMVYIASGSGFERLTRYMVLGFLPFYGLVALAAVKARRQGPPAAGNYTMPLYPLPVVLMLVYVACGIASGFAGDPVAALGGVVILAAGAIAYEFFRRGRREADRDKEK
jgi:APA family basic amino acid/polyamine antiporter